MPKHDCETYDFPVTQGTFDHTIKKTIVPALGGTGRQGVREAIEEVKERVTTDGENAMAQETCQSPCERAIYVEVTIDSVTARYTKKNKLEVRIIGIWKAGILCFKPYVPPAKKKAKKA
ncbi:MAG TPA: hypothetical protein VFY72_02505 [Beijerinckiaceae bacterium]|nr:hypothetical protein [Beijerinckiaceae bacterium]